MTSIEELLGNSAKTLRINPGAIFVGPMEGVDHSKYYIVAGISKDRVCLCSVAINSQINQFILKRPKLLALQIEITPEDYSFLRHKSYINCGTPYKEYTVSLESGDFTYKAQLDKKHLEQVVENVKRSQLLTEEDIELYFGE